MELVANDPCRRGKSLLGAVPSSEEGSAPWCSRGVVREKAASPRVRRGARGLEMDDDWALGEVPNPTRRMMLTHPNRGDHQPWESWHREGREGMGVEVAARRSRLVRYPAPAPAEKELVDDAGLPL